MDQKGEVPKAVPKKKKRVAKVRGLFQRPDSPYWWYDIELPNGKRERKSTGTADKMEAMQYIDQRRHDMWKVAKLGELPSRTWDEAVERYIAEVEIDCSGKRTADTYRKQLNWWGEVMGFSKLRLDQITKGDITEGHYRRAKESSQSTANRYLAPIRAMLYRAVDPWGWLQSSPSKFRQFDESGNARTRALSEGEMLGLLKQLPPHQKAIVEFDWLTGLRAQNVVMLEWAWIDMPHRVVTIPKGVIKNRTELTIPLTTRAMEIIRAQIGKHHKFVFTYRGNPVREVNTRAWRKALKRAGIEDYRWHDNRHTWAFQLRRKGVDLADIQDLGGWKDPKMVKRYATPDLERLREQAEKLSVVSERLRAVG